MSGLFRQLYAVRDAVVNGLAIRKGQFIGLVDNRVRRVADSLHDCIEAVARRA